MNSKVRSMYFSQEKIFYVALCLWIVFSVFFGRTTINKVLIDSDMYYSWGRNSIYVVLMLLTIKRVFKKNDFLLMLFSVVAIVLSIFKSDSAMLLGMFLFFRASGHSNVKKTVTYFLVVHVTIVAIALLLSHFDVLPDTIYYYNLSKVRHTYGFTHPNILGAEFLAIIFSYFYIRKENIRGLDYFIVIGLIAFMFLQTNARTASIAALLCVVVIWLSENIKVFNNERFWYICSNMVVVVMVLASLFFMLVDCYDVEFISWLDTKLSFRLSNTHTAYIENDIFLLGNNEVEALIDNSYIFLLFNSGSLIFVGFILFLFFVNKKLYKSGEKIGLIITLCYVIAGFSECLLLRVEHNVVVLIVGFFAMSSYSKNSTYNLNFLKKE